MRRFPEFLLAAGIIALLVLVGLVGRTGGGR
jgi:hypothetical protein